MHKLWNKGLILVKLIIGRGKWWVLSSTIQKKLKEIRNFIKKYILNKSTRSFHIFRSANLSSRRGNGKIPNIIGHFIAAKRQTTTSNILNILTHVVMQYINHSFLSNWPADFMYFINVSILGSKHVNSICWLNLLEDLKMTV